MMLIPVRPVDRRHSSKGATLKMFGVLVPNRGVVAQRAHRDERLDEQHVILKKCGVHEGGAASNAPYLGANFSRPDLGGADVARRNGGYVQVRRALVTRCS